MAVKASPTVEDYLHVIYQMSREGKPVIGTHLAEKMSVAVATTFATVQRMQKAGLVQMNDHKEILLTGDGKEAAEGVVRRHALAERLLVDVLRLPWHEAHEEAHQFEHVISPRVEERLMELLHSPSTCPHGNPIPGQDEGVGPTPCGSRAFRRASRWPSSASPRRRRGARAARIPAAARPRTRRPLRPDWRAALERTAGPGARRRTGSVGVAAAQKIWVRRASD